MKKIPVNYLSSLRGFMQVTGNLKCFFYGLEDNQVLYR
jgi:hypothetical protein